MKLDNEMSSEAVADELGKRLARLRIERNLTQHELAARAGVSRRSLERLEAGECGTSLRVLFDVVRALGVLGQIDVWIPEAVPTPYEILQESRSQKTRKRAGRKIAAAGDWKWGDEQ